MAQPTIRQGSSNKEAVKQWQRVIGVTADGIFGSGTATATKNWQRAHGLTADGVVGPATWAKADSIPFPETTPTAQPLVATAQTPYGPMPVPAVVAPIPPVTSTGAYPTLRQGSSNKAAVAEWQRIVGVKDDGIFGSGTFTATKMWQKAHNLTADGVVGPVTWSVARASQVLASPNPIQTAAQVALPTYQTVAQALPAVLPQLPQAPVYAPASAPAGNPLMTAATQAFQQAVQAARPPVVTTAGGAFAQTQKPDYSAMTNMTATAVNPNSSQPYITPFVASPSSGGYPLPSLPNIPASASITLPGAGNISAQSHAAQQQAETAALLEKRKRLYYVAGGVGGVAVLGTVLYFSMRKPKIKSSTPAT